MSCGPGELPLPFAGNGFFYGLCMAASAAAAATAAGGGGVCEHHSSDRSILLVPTKIHVPPWLLFTFPVLCVPRLCRRRQGSRNNPAAAAIMVLLLLLLTRTSSRLGACAAPDAAEPATAAAAGARAIDDERRWAAPRGYGGSGSCRRRRESSRFLLKVGPGMLSSLLLRRHRLVHVNVPASGSPGVARHPLPAGDEGGLGGEEGARACVCGRAHTKIGGARGKNDLEDGTLGERRADANSRSQKKAMAIWRPEPLPMAFIERSPERAERFRRGMSGVCQGNACTWGTRQYTLTLTHQIQVPREQRAGGLSRRLKSSGAPSERGKSE